MDTTFIYFNNSFFIFFVRLKNCLSYYIVDTPVSGRGRAERSARRCSSGAQRKRAVTWTTSLFGARELLRACFLVLSLFC